VPAQAGHFKRINATPSDLPFKSTGFATYPVPPQLGQSSGLNPLPLTVEGILHDWSDKFTKGFFPLRITNKNLPKHGLIPMTIGWKEDEEDAEILSGKR
jgi:hypothetical protein